MAAALLVSACVGAATPPPDAYGVSASHEGYVPARIAVMPCTAWPTRVGALPLSSLSAPELAQLCAHFDQFVLDGFNNQPFMKGHSPKFTTKALAAAGKPDPRTTIAGLWRAEAGACKECTNPPSIYRTQIAGRTAWRAWLAEMSAEVDNVDALLLPFVTYGFTRSYVDRGLAVAERAGALTLLLVDTTTGELLWSSGREAVAAAKRLTTTPGGAPQTPPWQAAEDRLLTEDLWRDFPGRQVF